MANRVSVKNFVVRIEGLGEFPIITEGPIKAVRAALSKAGKIQEAYKVVQVPMAKANVYVRTREGIGYYLVSLNTEELKHCDMGMLHQNWFSDMQMVGEFMDTQVFFDAKTRCIYVVDDTGEGINVEEVSPSNPKYGNYIARLEHK